MSSTHLNKDGTARMVDVGAKPVTARSASATGKIHLNDVALKVAISNNTPKGSVIAVATVAAISAAKRTSDLIPLCHNLSLDKVEVKFELDEKNSALICTATAKTHARTGVEMEALVAVHIGLLTVYDMCKSMDRKMKMSDIQLISKTGGTHNV